MKLTTAGNEDFLNAYIEAALWSSSDDAGESLDTNYSIDSIDPETLKKMEADCKAFLAIPEVQTALDEAYKHNLFENVIDQAGHDFWFTRNGDGVGFWESEWEPVGGELDKDATKFGEFNLYVEDEIVYGEKG